MPRKDTPKTTRTKRGRLLSRDVESRLDRRKKLIRAAPRRKVRRGGREYLLIELPAERPAFRDDYDTERKDTT